MLLNIGDKAPDFTLPDANGESDSLSDFKGKIVVLWFFPKASTPGWTVQGQGLRDEFKSFVSKNTIILGMSADSIKRQKNFAAKQEFQFQLLSDPDKEVIRSYRAIGMKKMYGREYEGILRIAYLIDEQGNIEKVYDKVSTKTFAGDVLLDLS